MKNAIWLALWGAVAALFLTIGSLNAENPTDTQNDDVSAKIVNTEGLNLAEQGSDNFYYYGAGYYYPYSYLSYYSYYSYYPYYYSYYPYYSYLRYPYYIR